MTADPHFGFIIAAYAIAFIIIAAMVFSILSDYFGLKRALARFPARRQRGEDEDAS